MEIIPKKTLKAFLSPPVSPELLVTGKPYSVQSRVSQALVNLRSMSHSCPQAGLNSQVTSVVLTLQRAKLGGLCPSRASPSDTFLHKAFQLNQHSGTTYLHFLFACDLGSERKLASPVSCSQCQAA